MCVRHKSILQSLVHSRHSSNQPPVQGIVHVILVDRLIVSSGDNSIVKMDSLRTDFTRLFHERGVSLPKILLLALLIRLALAPWSSGFGYDLDAFRDWAYNLLHGSFPHFYAKADLPDHLPGDLWLLWAASHLFSVMGGRTLEGVAFLITIKCISIVADLFVGFFLYKIVRRCASDKTAIFVAAAYLLNPASIFLSAFWGQWDSVSMALVLVTFWLFMLPGDRWLLGMPSLAWALMIKPQLALLVPFMLILPMRRAMTARQSVASAGLFLLPRLLAAGGIGVVIVSLIGMPFGVGLPGFSSQWPLLGRLDYALNIWQYTTMGAFNGWIIPIGSFSRWSDVSRTFLGFTPHLWGTALLVLAYVSVLVVSWRRSNTSSPEVIAVWGMLTASYAWFMLPTRVHERYLFPAFVLSLLLAGMVGTPRRWIVLAGALSAVFLLNLVAVYWSIPSVFIIIGACINVVLFIAVLFISPLSRSTASESHLFAPSPIRTAEER